jgi:glycosyltransferase involved in cell wall biosynthesis
MTSPAPVSVCMIVKNEQHQIENCLKSLRPHVAELCIVDTGSKDETPAICRKYADKFEVYTECNDSEGRITSFSQARQRSFDLATNPWVMWVDGDDEVRGAENLSQIIEEQEKTRNGQPRLVMFPYEYAHDHLGNVTCLHWRERLVAPGSQFKWEGPVHEVLIPKQPGTAFVQTDAVRIIHRRDMTKKPGEPMRNLRILKAHYDKVGEADVRQLYYLGLEYGNVGDLGNSIKFHKRYVELSGWDDEKFLACLKVSEHYQSMGDLENAIAWGLKSTTIREGWGEAYFNLSRSYYFMAQRGGPEERRNWEKSAHFAKMGLACPPTSTILFVNPLERSYEIHKYLNFALNKIGDVKGAKESVEAALSARPDDDGMKGNLRLYEIHLAKVEAQHQVHKLVELGDIRPEMETIIRDALHGTVRAPEPIQQSVVSADLVSDKIVFRSTKPLDLVVYVGWGPEPWNPDTMKKVGIGGSETAAAEMAKRLAARGHKVRLYGDCPGKEGKFDGVDYIHHDKFRNVECDVLITSRRPNMVDDEFGVKARATFCWVHDVSCGGALTHARALRIDRFLCLSQWHKQYFLGVHPCVHPDQVIVTRNGIDLSRFDEKTHGGPITRNPHRAVYGSSPDRGMEVAVKVWPEVRRRVPGAELHVFYGFQTWEVSARSANDRGQIELIERLKRTLEEAKVHGVHHHGRVDQVTLAKEFLSSGVWAYPTWFTETSCITAMEAQAAGLHIVTSPIAALNETVAERGLLVSGDWLSSDYQAKFVDGVVAAMEKGQDSEFRASQQAYAREHFGWDSLADEWDAMLNRTLDEVGKNVVVPYKGTT